MSPWTALLESLHSALIDELTERRPEPKPGLGLPLRKSSWSMPPTTASRILLVEVTQKDIAQVMPGSPPVGFVGLALDPECERHLGCDTETLWNAILKRAGSEFARRGIRPLVSRTLSTDQKAGLPASLAKSAQEPTRVVWIPLSLGEGSVFLGLGI